MTCAATTPRPNANGTSILGRRPAAPHRVLGLRVPARYGGPGGASREVLTAVVHIARGSSNVAQALRAHFGFAERLLSNRATEAERAHWFPAIDSGLVFGNAITDAKGKSPSSIGTTLRADAAGGLLRLNGLKFYSTGTLFADRIAVSASTPEDGICRRSCPPTATASNSTTTGTASGSG